MDLRRIPTEDIYGSGSVLGQIRTGGLPLRRRLLYPTELRRRNKMAL